jgi:hypothetical protein
MPDRSSKPPKIKKAEDLGVYRVTIQADPVQPADAVSLKEALKIRKREKEARNG